MEARSGKPVRERKFGNEGGTIHQPFLRVRWFGLADWKCFPLSIFYDDHEQVLRLWLG